LNILELSETYENILLVLISFVIIGCSVARSPIEKDFKEAKACEIYFLDFIGPFGNVKIIKAIQENYIKKVYAQLLLY